MNGIVVVAMHKPQLKLNSIQLMVFVREEYRTILNSRQNDYGVWMAGHPKTISSHNNDDGQH